MIRISFYTYGREISIQRAGDENQQTLNIQFFYIPPIDIEISAIHQARVETL